MITAGLPEPPGKCRARVCCAETEGVSFTKISSRGTPLEVRVGAKAAQATSAAREIAQMRRGARSTSAATRCHSGCPPAASGSPAGAGFAGQYAARPSSTRTAGRKVSVLSTAQTMPMAPTGPSARLLVRSLSSSASRARATVAALATTALQEARRAARTAVKRSGCRASSSRKRAVSSRA
ncbi:hypothetical protein STENM223S_03437 [Streptomyces tendae]